MLRNFFAEKQPADYKCKKKFCLEKQSCVYAGSFACADKNENRRNDYYEYCDAEDKFYRSPFKNCADLFCKNEVREKAKTGQKGANCREKHGRHQPCGVIYNYGKSCERNNLSKDKKFADSLLFLFILHAKIIPYNLIFKNMAKKTAEKVQKSEPDLIIPVDDFNKDKLGDHVARQISGFIGRKARRFGMPLHDTDTLQEASKCLDEFFGEVCGDGLTPDMRRVIYSVRLTLNKYYKSLGINLVSVNIEPRDKEDKPMLVDGKDLKAPTLGIVGTRLNSQQSVNMAEVGFKVERGAEQLHILSEQMHARGFGIGERMPESHGNQALLCPHPWERGDKVIIPAGAMVALDIPIADHKKFREQKLPYYDDVLTLNQSQGIYFCRYLTEKAVMDVLRQQAAH